MPEQSPLEPADGRSLRPAQPSVRRLLHHRRAGPPPARRPPRRPGARRGSRGARPRLPVRGAARPADSQPADGRGTHRLADVRRALTAWVTVPAHRADVEPLLHPLSSVTLHLPFEVADYVDFYASEHHATNVGRMFRPDGAALPANWKHLPIGYHGRAGTIVVSGTDVVRPSGQRKAPVRPGPGLRPLGRLDIEAEVGFVVGTSVRAGHPGGRSSFRDHVFGLCLLNDWSARDIQSWEYVPLGPFLGKSFATSVSAWVTPLEALDAARIAPPARTEPLLPYLRDTDDEEPGGFDLRISVSLNGHVISEPAVLHHVLDGSAAVGPYDGQRRLAAHRRPVRLRHRQRTATGVSAVRCSNSPGTAPSRSNSATASGPSWRTATRSPSPPGHRGPTGPGSAWAKSPAGWSPRPPGTDLNGAGRQRAGPDVASSGPESHVAGPVTTMPRPAGRP